MPKRVRPPRPMELPHVPGWPYVEINHELHCYISRNGRLPKFLYVGGELWSLLLQTVDANEFFCERRVQIRLDRSGILTPHEFMFTFR